MSKDPAGRRGRKPQISVASREAAELKRQAKAFVTAIRRLESRLAILDEFYSRAVALNGARGNGAATKPGRGPNVRDLAAEILKRSGMPMAIAAPAPRVAKARGKKPGKMFAVNLGTALRADRRFKRAGRGVYGLRRAAG